MTTKTDMPLGADEALDENGSTEFLSFVSDGLNFALPTSCVMEIITNYQITFLPRVAPYVKGVLNLRGQIIPIVDARIRMSQAAAENADENCIIILSIDGVDLGLLVDGVSNVLRIPPEEILPPPVNTRQELIRGIARIDEKPFLILDCEKLSK